MDGLREKYLGKYEVNPIAQYIEAIKILALPTVALSCLIILSQSFRKPPQKLPNFIDTNVNTLSIEQLFHLIPEEVSSKSKDVVLKGNTLYFYTDKCGYKLLTAQITVPESKACHLKFIQLLNGEFLSIKKSIPNTTDQIPSLELFECEKQFKNYLDTLA